METSASTIRVLVVDDCESWRCFVSANLQKDLELRLVAEASDGLEAVQKAEELQPDLILLDLGLPKLNGIEAAGRIRRLSPESKIVFLSENRSSEIARDALRASGGAYVVKSDAERDLLAGIAAVLEGKQFVSSSLASHVVVHPPSEKIP